MQAEFNSRAQKITACFADPTDEKMQDRMTEVLIDTFEELLQIGLPWLWKHSMDSNAKIVQVLKYNEQLGEFAEALKIRIACLEADKGILQREMVERERYVFALEKETDLLVQELTQMSDRNFCAATQAATALCRVCRLLDRGVNMHDHNDGAGYELQQNLMRVKEKLIDIVNGSPEVEPVTNLKFRFDDE